MWENILSISYDRERICLYIYIYIIKEIYIYCHPQTDCFVVLYCHLLIHAEIYIYILNTYRRNDKDAGRLLYKYMYLSLYCNGLKRVTQGLRVRGSWRPNTNCNILTPLLWPSALCLSRSPDAQPEALGLTLLGNGFLYGILSATSLDPNSIRGPSPFGLVWLSGASVYESIMGFFTLSYFISQFLPTRFPLITAIRMCHFLPVHHLEWHFWPGRRSKYNSCTTINQCRGCIRGVMIKAIDCGIVVSKFVLQSRHYDHFRANSLGKGMNPLILPAMG